MTDSQRAPTPVTHAAHDLTLVAALAARGPDLDEKTATAAREQVAACEACAIVLDDLVALQTTLPMTATPSRPRDFRLTKADAARLRRSGWRRVLGFFGSPRDGFSRPLAIGFTTLGLAGLLLASVPTMFMAGSGAASAPQVLSNVGAPIEQAAPAPAEGYVSERMSGDAAAAASEPAGGGVFSGANLDDGTSELAGDAGGATPRDDASGLPVLFVVAGVLLICGLGLFGLRWSARRVS